MAEKNNSDHFKKHQKACSKKNGEDSEASGQHSAKRSREFSAKEKDASGTKKSRTDSPCPICQDVVNAKDYSNHVKTCALFHNFMKNVANGEFQCKLCPTVRKTKSEMNQHLKNDHESQILQTVCDFCLKKVNRPDLMKHVRICDDFLEFTNENSCKICDQDFNNLESVYDHLINFHQMSKSDTNLMEPNQTSTAAQIKKEIFESEREKPELLELECDFCEQKVYENELLSHMKSCPRLKKFANLDSKSCRLCTKTFSTIEGIYAHVVKSHHDFRVKTESLENNTIDAIGQDSSADSTTMENSSINDSTTKSTQNCVVPKITKSTSEHLMKCEICSKEFTNIQFNKHIEECKLYGKFIKEDENTKRISCMKCSSKNFRSLKNAYQHIRVDHADLLKAGSITNELANDSGVLEKSTNSTNVTESEKSVDSGKSSDICQYCGEIKSKQGQKNHVQICLTYHPHFTRSIRETNPYKCKLCKKKYMKMTQLFSHLQVAHGKEIKKLAKENTENIAEKSKKAPEKRKSFSKETANEEGSPDSLRKLKTNCPNCKDMIRKREFKTHMDDCVRYNKFIKELAHGFKCLICKQNLTKTNKFEHLKSEHSDWLLKNTNQDVGLQKCTICDEAVSKEGIKEHQRICREAAQFVNDDSCLICDRKLSSKIDALDHVKQEHDLSIESTKERQEKRRNDIINIKREHVENDGPICIIKDVSSNSFENGLPCATSTPGFANMPMINMQKDVSDSTEMLDDDPTAITKIHVCPICEKKFLSRPIAQDHIFKYHRIPIHVQEKMDGMGMKIMEIDV